MAEIRQYISNESAAAPIGGRRAQASDFSSGIDFSGAANQLESTANRLQQSAEEQDVSDVHVKLSETRAKWTQELLKRSQTDAIDNPDFADQFTTEMHNDASGIGDGVQTKAGQRAFRQGLADMTAGFSGSAGVYQAQQAGVKAKNDYHTYLNNNQLTLLHDPNQFDAILAEANSALNDPAGRYSKLKGSDREALARVGANDMAKSAMLGIINQNPEAGKAMLEDGKSSIVQSLDADTVGALQAHAEQGINAKRIDQERAIVAQEKADRDARDATLNGFITKLVSDPTSMSAKDVVNSNLKPEQRIAVLGWIQKGLTGDKGDSDVHNAVFNDLWARIHAPDGDESKITDPSVLDSYVSNDTLSFPQLQILRGEIAGKGTPEQKAEGTLTSALDSLAEKSLVVKDPITGFLDPNDQEGNRLLYQYRAWFLTEYPKRRETKSAEQLLTPGSPDFMGTMIDTLKAQRKSVPGLSTGAAGLLAPDGATPGTPSPAAETKTVNGVTYTKNPADGKWYK